MNSYCTIVQLTSFYDVKTIAELSDDTESGELSQVIVQQCLDAAASRLDSVFAGRWTVPVLLADGTAPPIITQHCAVLAMYNLYRRKSRIPEIFTNNDLADTHQFLQDVLTSKLSFATITRSGAYPQLVASGSFNGRSKWDPPSWRPGPFFDPKG